MAQSGVLTLLLVNRTKGTLKKIHSDYVGTMAVQQNGNFLITASHDKTVGVFGIQEKKLIKKFPGLCGDEVDAFVLLSDDSKACMGSGLGEMKIIDLENGEIIYDFQTPHKCTRSIILTHDQKFILSADYLGGTVKKWDALNYEQKGNFKFNDYIRRIIEV